MCCCCPPPRRSPLIPPPTPPAPAPFHAVAVRDDDFGPVLRGHILAPVTVQVLAGVQYTLCAGATMISPVGLVNSLHPAMGWYVAKSVRPFPGQSGYQLVEVFVNGDTIRISDIDPTLQAAWLAAGLGTMVFVGPAAGVPCPGTPFSQVPVGQSVSMHPVAQPITLCDPDTGLGERAFRLIAELVDGVNTDNPGVSKLTRIATGRAISA